MMTEHLLMMQDPHETCRWKETAGHCGNSIRPADTLTGVTGSRKELREWREIPKLEPITATVKTLQGFKNES